MKKNNNTPIYLVFDSNILINILCLHEEVYEGKALSQHTKTRDDYVNSNIRYYLSLYKKIQDGIIVPVIVNTVFNETYLSRPDILKSCKTREEKTKMQELVNYRNKVQDDFMEKYCCFTNYNQRNKAKIEYETKKLAMIYGTTMIKDGDEEVPLMELDDTNAEAKGDIMIAAEAGYLGLCILTNDNHFLTLESDHLEFNEQMQSVAALEQAAYEAKRNASYALKKAMETNNAEEISKLEGIANEAQARHAEAKAAKESLTKKHARADKFAQLHRQIGLGQEQNGYMVVPKPISLKELLAVLAKNPNYVFSKPVNPIERASTPKTQLDQWDQENISDDDFAMDED
ncbi:MAG: hypothetical protein E7356_03980 [Clostridiales bacterium]|nr:hypothetical protein [Clostridiales bacterium]